MVTSIRNIVFIFLFLCMLIAPMTMRMVAALTVPYGQKPFTVIESWGDYLLSGSPEKYKELSQSMFERSPLTRQAIITKNTFLYQYFGFIDNERIISGFDGWLFAKRQFNDGRCIDKVRIVEPLNRAQLATAMGSVSGIRIIFSMSPNKSSIYPEKLHPRSKNLTGCTVQNAAIFRKELAERAPRVLDHTDMLLAYKDMYKTKGLDVYLSTDTHWTELGAWLAYRELTARVLRKAPENVLPDPSYPTHRNDKRPTDMASSMLLIADQDQYHDLDQEELAALRRTIRQLPGRYVVMHDSFYRTLDMISAFPKLKRLELWAPSFAKEINRISLKDRPTFIFNAVERGFIARLETLESETDFFQKIYAHNFAQAKRRCGYPANSQTVTVTSPNNSLQWDGNQFVKQSANPRLLIRTEKPVAGQCLRFTVDVAKAGVFTLFLPPLNDTINTKLWERGRTVPINLTPGEQTIHIMLPRSLTGRQLRLDTGNQQTSFRLKNIALGTPDLKK